MKARTYLIEVEGELSARYLAAFGNMRLEIEDGNTLIAGVVEDQAQLHGLLDTIAALGLSLVSVTST